MDIDIYNDMLCQISDTLNLTPEEMLSLDKWFRWFIMPLNSSSEKLQKQIKKTLKL
jgi:hypothetical protein